MTNNLNNELELPGGDVMPKVTVTAILGTALFVEAATADAANMSHSVNHSYASEKVNAT